MRTIGPFDLRKHLNSFAILLVDAQNVSSTRSLVPLGEQDVLIFSQMIHKLDVLILHYLSKVVLVHAPIVHGNFVAAALVGKEEVRSRVIWSVPGCLCHT